MKKILLTTAIVGSVLTLGACSSTNQTVATVGNQKITQDEFYQQLKTANGQQVLEQMIENVALASKYTVTDKEIQDQITKVKANFKNETDFKKALAQYNINSDAQLNDYMKNSLLHFKAIADGVKVTDKELQDFYNQNQDNYKTVEASHILVSTEKDAQDILSQLQKGADFATLAKKYSKDSSAVNGGSLGTFGKGQMVSEFEKAAFALKPGQISGVVKTQYGYHIIKVTKVNQKTLKDSKDLIEKDYITQKNSSAFPSIMAKLLQNTKVDVQDQTYKDLVQQMIQNYQSQEQSAQQSSQSAVQTTTTAQPATTTQASK